MTGRLRKVSEALAAMMDSGFPEEKARSPGLGQREGSLPRQALSSPLSVAWPPLWLAEPDSHLH